MARSKPPTPAQEPEELLQHSLEEQPTGSAEPPAPEAEETKAEAEAEAEELPVLPSTTPSTSDLTRAAERAERASLHAQLMETARLIQTNTLLTEQRFRQLADLLEKAVQRVDRLGNEMQALGQLFEEQLGTQDEQMDKLVTVSAALVTLQQDLAAQAMAAENPGGEDVEAEEPEA